MKRILSLLMLFCSLAAMGQYPVSSISITMPPNPAANTGDWAMPFVITAQAKLVQGQVPGNLMESRILVTVKEAMLKKCGSYTQQTAPMSNFNTATKSWSGAAAVGFLGNGCTLKPGTYELCVQFFSGYAPVIPLSNEVCKSFTIADTKQQSYSPPQNIMPANGKVFTEQEAGMPIMLRWTPVVPKPQGDVLYKVRLIEILPGQNKTEALRTNTPIDILEVKNNTQTSYKLSKRITGLYWEVEAESAERVQGEKPRNYGKSEATSFSVKKGDIDPDTANPPKNVTPADGKVFSIEEASQPILFKWIPVLPKPKEDLMYKVRVVEIKKGQSKAEALKTNTPIEVLEVKNLTQVSSRLSKRCNNCEYIWDVEAVGTQRVQGEAPKSYGTSEATSFMVATAICAMRPTLVETSCIGTTATSRTIRVKIKIENISSGANAATVYMNHTNTFTHPLYSSLGLNPSNLIQGKDQNFVVSPGVNSIVPFSPLIYPSTIASGNFAMQEVDVNINNSITSFRLLVITTSQGLSSGDALVPCYQDILIENIPPCPCTYCKDDMIVFNGPNQITDANNILTLNNNISIPGIQVKQFKAELIGISYAPQNGNEQCWVCNKDDNQWGNFTNGTFSSPFPSMVNGVFPSLPCCGGNSHHTIGWWGTATTINNRPLQLKISLPPASTLSCCPYNITVCIRYTFTDIECRSCSVVRCFSYIRQPQAGPGPGPHLDLNNSALEIVPLNEIKN